MLRHPSILVDIVWYYIPTITSLCWSLKYSKCSIMCAPYDENIFQVGMHTNLLHACLLLMSVQQDICAVRWWKKPVCGQVSFCKQKTGEQLLIQPCSVLSRFSLVHFRLTALPWKLIQVSILWHECPSIGPPMTLLDCDELESLFILLSANLRTSLTMQAPPQNF